MTIFCHPFKTYSCSFWVAIQGDQQLSLTAIREEESCLAVCQDALKVVEEIHLLRSWAEENHRNSEI